MVYIKKLVMHGFKSFVRKTELPFTPGINVVLGPNGSGKSNITDSLCFVLGRLSVKSMRAAKAKNLIFMGSKVASPAKEASVEIVFDNTDNTFSIEKDEVSIRRIVRRNGQSVYKINNETKTRQQILALLAQAGIDPNGFNIILQGEIQNFVRMHTEERRKIIEEVSGISVYEMRKAKSLKELERIEEKLKEIMAILKERTAYLNNLEKERQQALRFKKLEHDVKKFKASIINFELVRKKKEAENFDREIAANNSEIEKIKKIIAEIEAAVKTLEEKIDSINLTISQSAGIEQEKLNQEIANLRAELAGLQVRFDNSEKRSFEFEKHKQELNELIRNNEVSIKQLQKESPTIARKQKEIEAKRQELEELEKQRKKFYMTRSELKSVSERLDDKKSVLQSYESESGFLIDRIKSISLELFDKKSDAKKLSELKVSLAEKRSMLNSLGRREIELEKISHTNEYEINNQNKIIEKISKMDVCPLCKSTITKEHMASINSEIKPLVEKLQREIENSDKELNDIYQKREILERDVEQIAAEISKRDSDLIKLSDINGKKEQIKSLQEKTDEIQKEIAGLEKRRKNLESNFDGNSNIEQKYETAQVEMQEISLRSRENVSSEISFKQQELERARISLKQVLREQDDLKDEIAGIRKTLEQKEKLLSKKREQEEKLSRKFEQLIAERDSCNAKIRANELKIASAKNSVYNFEQKINEFKIDRARVNAEIENFESEMSEFDGVALVRGTREQLAERLAKTQEILARIGSVNLRALEVYDSVKKEYDVIQEKVEVIAKEKQGILKIVHEIDIKKKKTFLKTLNELNEIFSRNFSQLSAKGQVWLELENRKEPFEGGVGIVVKTGHGKYFDVTSLSGGEQTLVALSLIFAIQELSPYCFYILDEIDAALDKRNSERLAGLLKKYMQKGQYIVITHNDEVITRATNIFGVSMHDGVSKVLSLKV